MHFAPGAVLSTGGSMAVTLYRQVGRDKARRYTKVNLGPGRRPIDLAGPYFLRYSLPNGTRPWEPVGGDLEAAIDAQKQKQAYFDALDAGVPLAAEQEESSRMKMADAVSQWPAELRIFQGKDQQGKSEKTLRAYTPTVSDSFSISRCSKTYGSSTRLTAVSFCLCEVPSGP